MTSRIRHLLAVALAAGLSACSALPNDGPTVREIAPDNGGDALLRNYVIVDVNTKVASILARFVPEPFSKRFAAARPAPGQIIGVGDVLQITLFEAGQGGLFTSEQGARVTFPATVGADGSITVPYGGRVAAAGRSPADLERTIVRALEGKAIQPQAVVTMSTVVGNSVVVNGDVQRPGRLPISPTGDKLLDAIANAGGVRGQPFETEIQLVRGGRSGRTMMKTLVDDDASNVYVQPGDKIFVSRSPQSYTILGSAMRAAEVKFDMERLSVVEAVAKVGGLHDLKADVTGLFLFRYEDDRVARAVDPTYDGRFGASVPVVYRFNMGDPEAYFYGKNFEIRNKDVLYVANAQSVQLLKFLQVLNAGLASASGATQNYYFLQAKP